MTETKQTKRPTLKVVKTEKAPHHVRECTKSDDGKHQWSEASTFPFCIWCGEAK